MTTPDEASAKAAFAYNAAADSYDDAVNSFWDRFGRRTVERLDLQPGARVLDVCCGTGASAIPAAEQVGPEGFVLGVAATDAERLDVVAEEGSHALRSAEDWWPMVLGTGYRGTIEQLDAEARAKVRGDTIAFIRAAGIQAVEANVVYAVATKSQEVATDREWRRRA